MRSIEQLISALEDCKKEAIKEQKFDLAEFYRGMQKDLRHHLELHHQDNHTFTVGIKGGSCPQTEHKTFSEAVLECYRLLDVEGKKISHNSPIYGYVYELKGTFVSKAMRQCEEVLKPPQEKS